MRVKFAPPTNGRRVSQLDESMEVDTTSITKSKLLLGKQLNKYNNYINKIE